MPLLYDIPAALKAAVSLGQAELVGAVIKDVASGRILGHVQQTRGLYEAALNAGGLLVQGGSPLGLVTAVQNEQIKASLAELGRSVGILQHMQLANLALSGFGIGVSVAGFALLNRRLTSLEGQIRSLHEEVRQIGKLIEASEIRRLAGEIRSALKDLDHAATRTDYLGLATGLQRQFSTHASVLGDILHEALDLGRASTLSFERVEFIRALSSLKWMCQVAELRALFVSNDLRHADIFAERHVRDNMEFLSQLNPDAMARLMAASEKGFAETVVVRQRALSDVRLLVNGFKSAIGNLEDQKSLARALLAAEVNGRDFVEAAMRETEKPFLFVEPSVQPGTSILGSANSTPASEAGDDVRTVPPRVP